MKNFLTFLYLFPNFSFLPDNYDNWYLLSSSDQPRLLIRLIRVISMTSVTISTTVTIMENV